MDIDLLRTFLEIYRTHHFGEAAENLCVTQSTISARIKLLEDRLGVPLFTRARGNIQPTSSGQRFLRYAESIVTTWNRARQEVAAEQENAVLLSVGGVPSLWDIALQDWMQWIVRELPEVSVNAEVANTDLLLRRLLEGDLDLGFFFEVPQGSELEVNEIMTVPLTMVTTTPGLNSEQAIGTGYLLVDWGTSFGRVHAQHFPNLPTPRLRLGLGRLARDFLLDQGGAAYLAEGMVASELEDGRLFRVADAPVIERSAYAVYSPVSDRTELLGRALAYFKAPRGD